MHTVADICVCMCARMCMCVYVSQDSGSLRILATSKLQSICLELGLGCVGATLAVVYTGPCTWWSCTRVGGRAPASVFDLHVLCGHHSRT